jgi:mRNA-degrading endonuclease RelE of RelBE toxin-antitoxin system
MYKIKVTNTTLSRINTLCKNESTFESKIRLLESNPLTNAIPTNIPAIGNYYINCGNRTALLFNVDEDNEMIFILDVYYRSRLYEIISGRRNNL